MYDFNLVAWSSWHLKCSEVSKVLYKAGRYARGYKRHPRCIRPGGKQTKNNAKRPIKIREKIYDADDFALLIIYTHCLIWDFTHYFVLTKKV